MTDADRAAPADAEGAMPADAEGAMPADAEGAIPADDEGAIPARRALFVAGLGHSGSTLLHLLLAATPGWVALGEIEQTFRPLHRRRTSPCTCGAPAPECPIWGPVLAALPRGTEGDVARGYRILLDHLDTVLPPETGIVDASKNPFALDGLLAARPRVDVDAILLVRDVRSWTTSSRRRAARTGRLDWRAALRRGDVRAVAARRHLTGWGRFRLWEQRNLAIEQHLRAAGVLRAIVGYEPLATAPDRTLGPLYDRLDLGPPPDAWRPADGVGHILEGNLPSLRPEATGTITYSTTWLSTRDWLWPSVVHRRIMATNDRLVYDREHPRDA